MASDGTLNDRDRRLTNQQLSASNSTEAGTRGFEHILKRPEARHWCIDQHRHVSWLMLIAHHAHVGLRNLLPGKDLGHARIDPPLYDEAVRLGRLQQVGEVR